MVISYLQNGYFALRSFYTLNDINTILEATKNCLKNKNVQIIKEDDGKTIRSIMHYHLHNKILNQYSRDSRIIELIQQLIGTPVYISQSKINLKKGKKGKKWDYHRGFTFWHLLDGKPEPKMISVFICLTDQTKENGAVYVLKESHKNVSEKSIKEESEFINRTNHKKDTSSKLSIQIKENYIEKYQSEYEKEYLTGKAGDVFFMHPKLLHASDKNTTNISRDLMITVFNSIDNLPLKSDRPNYLCEPFKGALEPYKL
jgi:ectoine hydroxylase